MRGPDDEPVFVTAGEIARNFGRWQDEATRGPVVVTHHGRPRVVVVSADTFTALAHAGPGGAAVAENTFETRLNAVLSHSVEGFFALDHAMTITGVNRVFEDFFGMAASQMVGRPYAEVFPGSERSMAWEQFQRVLRTGEPSEFEMLSKARTDTVLNVRAFPYSGGMGSLFVNRTEERTMSDRMRGVAALELALNAADHAGIIELNIRGGIVSASGAFERLTSFGPGELARCRLIDLLVPRTRPGVSTAIDAALNGDGPQSASAVVLGRDGRETRAKLGIAAISDQHQITGAKVVVLPQD
jgi:prevent-host-death family protein